MTLDLDAEERAQAAPIEAAMSQRAHFPVTLAKLVSWWDDLVRQVEVGYTSSADEYANDLSARDRLEEALRSAPPKLRSKLEAAVTPLDERFRQATHPDPHLLLSQFVVPGDGGWWARIPKVLAGALASDLKGRNQEPG